MEWFKLPFTLVTVLQCEHLLKHKMEHAYRTAMQTTLFSLVYGMDLVLPIEVEIPSLKVLMETKLEEVE